MFSNYLYDHDDAIRHAHTFDMCTLQYEQIDYEKKLKAMEEEEARVKQHQKEQRRAKKQKKQTSSLDNLDIVHSEDVTTKSEAACKVPDDTEAEMMAMMGFGGFGSSKKSC